MKGKKFGKKLKLNKFTVANMPDFDLSRVFAGNPMCSDACTGQCLETIEFPECKLMTDMSTTMLFC